MRLTVRRISRLIRHHPYFMFDRHYTDEYGKERSYVDDDLRYQAEIALFRAIAGFQFREPPDDFMP